MPRPSSTNSSPHEMAPPSFGGPINRETAARVDVVLVAVPEYAHEKALGDVADALDGKIVIDCVNPLTAIPLNTQSQQMNFCL